MRGRIVIASAVTAGLVLGVHQARLGSAGPVAGQSIQIPQAAPIQPPRPESFIPGIPTVVNTPVALLKVIAIPGAPLASTAGRKSRRSDRGRLQNRPLGGLQQQGAAVGPRGRVRVLRSDEAEQRLLRFVVHATSEPSDRVSGRGRRAWRPSCRG